jgi:hypothetical protein
LRRAAGREWKWEKSEEWKWKWKEGIREEGLTRSEDFGGGVVQVVSEPWHRTHSMEADANDIFAPALALPSSICQMGRARMVYNFFSFSSQLVPLELLHSLSQKKIEELLHYPYLLY